MIDPIFSSEATAVEYIAHEKPHLYVNKKSQILKSPLYTDECDYSPSPLKGLIDGQTPMYRLFQKSLKLVIGINPNYFDEEKQWLNNIYKPVNNKQKVLTLNKAVFGNENMGIKCISSTASTGYQWAYKKFFD
ncbi:hypothetical protein A3Q56_06004 [Intoshia linei]|uniref:Uncharacterized protein n=1 Tax=Intoshia linei TaxID=1819745 RepID=A0A177AW82_9BILA|nr:hypothetical protein A3Q56_06004 [Intoshia linei]